MPNLASALFSVDNREELERNAEHRRSKTVTRCAQLVNCREHRRSRRWLQRFRASDGASAGSVVGWQDKPALHSGPDRVAEYALRGRHLCASATVPKGWSLLRQDAQVQFQLQP